MTNDEAAGSLEPAAAVEAILPPAEQPIWQRVLGLAWPVLVQQFLILAVGLSDQFLAGYFQPLPLAEQAEAASHQLTAIGILGGSGAAPGLGAALAAEAPWQAARQIKARHIAYQSAQTTANYLAWFLSSYCVLVTVGSTALVARFVGAGDWHMARRTTNQSMVLAVILGLVGTLAGLATLDGLLQALQMRGFTAAVAADYLRPLLVLLVFQVIELAGIACLVGAGDTRMGLWVLGSVAVINLPLAWLFFHGLGPIPPLGFSGIALGTALSHTLGGLAVLVVLACGRAGLKLRFDMLRPDGVLLRRILRVSVPAGFDSLSVATGHLWFLSIVNRLGEVASAAHGIALRWEGLGYLSGGAFGTAAMTLVGQNLGAGKPARAAQSGWVAFGLGCGVMCAMAAVFFVLAQLMFAPFCRDPEQAPVIDAGVPVLRLVAFAMPALACCIIFTYALRGAGDTRVPVLFTWVGFLGVRIPLAYFFTMDRLDLGPLGTWPGLHLGLLGAWLAMFADIVVRGGFFLVRFAGGRWQAVQV
jgi:putative MATE family efflux protein